MWWLLAMGCQRDMSLVNLQADVAEPTAPGPAVTPDDAPDPSAPVTWAEVVPSEATDARARQLWREHDLTSVMGRIPVMRVVLPDPATTSAIEVWEGTNGDVRRERHTVGPRRITPVADFLFIVDNSVSMRAIFDRVEAAFIQLSQDDPFPAGARIGVMTTLPADPYDLGVTHPAITKDVNQAWEPGFVALVDRPAIARYRARMPEYADRFPYIGCAAWFGPFERGIDNVPCLTAHIQTVRTAVGVEAGLTAVAQMLAVAEGPVFRPGAAVNLVFVSDTHDPGVGKSNPYFYDLVEIRPSAARILGAVLEDQQVASFRIHAIAPASTACGERSRAAGLSYFEAAQATGGLVRDICTDPDYAELVRAIAALGPQITEPVVTLGAPTSDRAVVRLDGQVTEWTVAKDRRSLKTRTRLDRDHDVEVTYLRADARAP